MNYRVKLSKKASKFLTKLDKPACKVLLNWIWQNLEGTSKPRLYGKVLTGNLKGYWRYRVGDYRLIAKICDDKILIYIISIDNRRNVYRQ